MRGSRKDNGFRRGRGRDFSSKYFNQNNQNYRGRGRRGRARSHRRRGGGHRKVAYKRRPVAEELILTKQDFLNIGLEVQSHQAPAGAVKKFIEEMEGVFCKEKRSVIVDTRKEFRKKCEEEGKDAGKINKNSRDKVIGSVLERLIVNEEVPEWYNDEEEEGLDEGVFGQQIDRGLTVGWAPLDVVKEETEKIEAGAKKDIEENIVEKVSTAGENQSDVLEIVNKEKEAAAGFKGLDHLMGELELGGAEVEIINENSDTQNTSVNKPQVKSSEKIDSAQNLDKGEKQGSTTVLLESLVNISSGSEYGEWGQKRSFEESKLNIKLDETFTLESLIDQTAFLQEEQQKLKDQKLREQEQEKLVEEPEAINPVFLEELDKKIEESFIIAKKEEEERDLKESEKAQILKASPNILTTENQGVIAPIFKDDLNSSAADFEGMVDQVREEYQGIFDLFDANMDKILHGGSFYEESFQNKPESFIDSDDENKDGGLTADILKNLEEDPSLVSKADSEKTDQTDETAEPEEEEDEELSEEEIKRRKEQFLRRYHMPNLLTLQMAEDCLRFKDKFPKENLPKSGLTRATVNQYKQNDYRIFSLYTRGNLVMKQWYIKDEEGEKTGPFCSFDMDLWNQNGKLNEDMLISPNDRSYFRLSNYLLRENSVLDLIVEVIEEQEKRMKVEMMKQQREKEKEREKKKLEREKRRKERKARGNYNNNDRNGRYKDRGGDRYYNKKGGYDNRRRGGWGGNKDYRRDRDREGYRDYRSRNDYYEDRRNRYSDNQDNRFKKKKYQNTDSRDNDSYQPKRKSSKRDKAPSEVNFKKQKEPEVSEEGVKFEAIPAASPKPDQDFPTILEAMSGEPNTLNSDFPALGGSGAFKKKKTESQVNQTGEQAKSESGNSDNVKKDSALTQPPSGNEFKTADDIPEIKTRKFSGNKKKFSKKKGKVMIVGWDDELVVVEKKKKNRRKKKRGKQSKRNQQKTEDLKSQLQL